MLQEVTKYNPCFSQIGTIDTDNWERVGKILKRYKVEEKSFTLRYSQLGIWFVQF